MPEVNGAIIEPLAEKIKEINNAYGGSRDSYLYSGMGVLARDMYYYLSLHPRSDAKLFQDIIPLVIEEEKKAQEYVEGYFSDNKSPFPYDDSEIGVLKLPKGIVEAAAGGKIDISALYTDNIIHEWTSFTGRILFQRFNSKFKGVICGKGGPYEQFNKGVISEKGLPMSIIIIIGVATHGFSNDTFWIPIILYFSVILVRVGLKEYCKA